MGRSTPLAAIALLFASLTATAEIIIHDDSGREIRLPRPAERIVSLAPHLTELLFAAGAGDRLIGAVRYSDYPPAAAKLPRVGDAHRFDLERILAQQPDLVVAWESGNPAAQIRQLRESGVTMYLSEPRQFEDIAATLEALGTLAGSRPQAERAAADFRRRLASLRRDYTDHANLRVFYQVWHEPLITIGAGHIINEAMALCGGQNVFAEIDQLAPRVGIESVLAAAPEVIVASGSSEQRPDWLDNWQRWSQLPAVKNGQLYFIPPALIQRHTPRILDGTQRLCEILDRAREQSE